MTTADQTPEEPAELDALLALAMRQHRAGRLAEAAAAYRQILALRPDIAEAHNNLGVVLRHQGRLEQAAARYRQAVALKPNYADAYNNLGNVLREQGQLDQAAARFEQSLAVKPSLFQAHNSLGRIFRRQGKLDQARARFEQRWLWRRSCRGAQRPGQRPLDARLSRPGRGTF